MNYPIRKPEDDDEPDYYGLENKIQESPIDNDARIPEIRWDDVILPQKTKEELINYMKGIMHPYIFQRYGIKPTRNIILTGAPGTGKTLSVKAIATESCMDMMVVNCNDILTMWYGQSSKNLQKAFDTARKIAKANKKGCIMFFDELDSLAGKRSEIHEASKKIVSTFLTNMDGIYTNSGIYVVGTTNLPESIDVALTRPGRFDKIIKIDLPDNKCREKLFKLYVNKIREKAKLKYITNVINYTSLAENTNKFSGADIEYIVNETCSKKMWYDIKNEVKEKDIQKIRTNDFLNTIKEYDFNRGGSRKITRIKGFSQ